MSCLYLNIGCGDTFDSSWLNLDFSSSSDSVKTCDIRKGLLFSDDYFSVCYSSHLIEHLTQIEAQKLINECFRVLKLSGIIRLVVPDLEAIARNYLLYLEKASEGDTQAVANYDWMMLELYDQTVRKYIGGEIGKYLSNPAIENKDFVLSRFGYEAENYLEKENHIKQYDLFTKLRSKSLSQIIKKVRINIAKTFVFLFAGDNSLQSFEEGLFRNTGEVHRWMYDRFSLKRILEKSGFVDIRICQADESSIPNFNSYGLDMINGKVRKPDSLFIEGFKL